MSHNTDWHVEIEHVAKCQIDAILEALQEYLADPSSEWDYSAESGVLELWDTGHSYGGYDDRRACDIAEAVHGVLGSKVPIRIIATFVEHAPYETYNFGEEAV